jgi:hypothetical protein
MQRGEHEIDDELIFTRKPGYVFHDSRGFEAGDEKELKIVQEFVHRKSQERRLDDRLHAIWFASFDISNCDFIRAPFPFQVLRSDGQRSAIARFKAF